MPIVIGNCRLVKGENVRRFACLKKGSEMEKVFMEFGTVGALTWPGERNNGSIFLGGFDWTNGFRD